MSQNNSTPTQPGPERIPSVRLELERGEDARGTPLKRVNNLRKDAHRPPGYKPARTVSRPPQPRSSFGPMRNGLPGQDNNGEGP